MLNANSKLVSVSSRLAESIWGFLFFFVVVCCFFKDPVKKRFAGQAGAEILPQGSAVGAVKACVR